MVIILIISITTVTFNFQIRQYYIVNKFQLDNRIAVSFLYNEVIFEIIPIRDE